MNTKELLKFCMEKGLLVDEEVLSLFSETGDVEGVKVIIEKIKNHTQKRIITKKLFSENKETVNRFFSDLPEKNQKRLENLKIQLGISIKISKEISTEITKPIQTSDNWEIIGGSDKYSPEVKILSSNFSLGKKLEVKDFVTYFKNRYVEIKNILQNHYALNNLISINKISGDRSGFSIIGLVSSKHMSKNKNILLEVEDLTGKTKVFINNNKPDLFKKAEEVALDSVIGIAGSGKREILFANEIVFPDSVILERKKSPLDESALFIGDLHYGSKKFLEANFLKFIDYVNNKLPNTIESEKIKYLFIVGDLVTGIGNYPNQERDLKINDLEEQFVGVTELLSKIRIDVKIIITPGNHDCVRLMEPQPLFDEKYAWPLYNLKNVVLTENPVTVNIGAVKNFSGFNVLSYHGFSFPYYANTIPKLMVEKSMNSPEKIMAYLLKNRHLAPTHTSTQYFPSKEDTHLIKNIPDIFFAGHTHKSAVAYHNNILLVSSSSWEEKTPYQEKFGNEPDHCKVPMFNLKTRAVKILDFE